MFNISWGELLILLIAGLVILGPERLPGAISWLSHTVRHVREYAQGTTDQIRKELGPEFENLRQPLSELRQLRNMGEMPTQPRVSPSRPLSPALSPQQERKMPPFDVEAT